MREAIERANINLMRREKDLEDLLARSQGNRNSRIGANLRSIFTKPQMERERAEIDAQLDALNSQRRSSLSQALRDSGVNVNPDNFSVEDLQKLRFAQLGQQTKPVERKIVKDVAGFNRYQDTGERVFPDAQPEKKQPMVTVNTGNVEEEAFDKEIGKKRAAAISGFIDEEINKTTQLQQSMQATNVIEGLLNEGVQTAGFAGIKIGLGNAVRLFGGDPSKIPALSDINSLETIEGMTNKLVIPLAKELGYNPTDADAKRIESSVAGLGKGVAANRALIGFIRNTARKQQVVQDFINEVETSGDPKRFRSLRSDVNKLRKSFLDEELAKLEQLGIASKGKSKQSGVGSLPEGATQIGTSGGKPVYQTPDGRTFVEE